MEDDLGNRMKEHEGAEAERRFARGLPIMARLDGRAFRTFCRGLIRPYDPRLHGLMARTTEIVVAETGALAGYTQSDEISLVFFASKPESQVFFDGRVQKMTSTLAALTSVHFNRLLPGFVPEKGEPAVLPTFDCRVWTVPDQAEVANTFLWRNFDATRNSILALGQAHFGHRELHGQSARDVVEMLRERKGVKWEDSPDWSKYGTWVRRIRKLRPFTATEIARLPARHEARTNPELVVERWTIRREALPLPFGRMQNREGFIFREEGPMWAATLPRP